MYKRQLENLAKNISFKVKRTKRPVSLEPMNPFERRVIHSALQNMLAKYGVQAVTQLQPDQYGVFATELRTLGAQL